MTPLKAIFLPIVVLLYAAGYFLTGMMFIIREGLLLWSLMTCKSEIETAKILKAKEADNA